MEPAILTSLLRLDPKAKDTLVAQVYRGLSAAVRDGRLPQGARLPSTRAAAQSWGIARNTVVAAYDLLASEGVIVQRQGAAPRVAAFAAAAPAQGAPPPPLSRRGAALANDPRVGSGRNGPLAPGEPDAALFPVDDWALCLRRAARHRHASAEGYGAYEGLPDLRVALADQISRHRGTPCTPDSVIVTPGTQASLALLAQVLCDAGDTALIEDPGYGGASRACLAAGAVVRPLPVDAEGADCAAVDPDIAPRLIYLSPSTQYPTGVRMTQPRRQAALAYAQRHGAWVIEDDYDSEFVWHGREIAALSAQKGAQNVIYLGSAAKTLLPGLRLGWIVAPPALVPALVAAQRTLGMAANLHAQAALAEFIAGGQYRAHLRRISKAYGARRDMLAQALTAWHGERLHLSQPDGGLQLVAQFFDDVDETTLRDRLRAEGFAVAGLSEFRQTPGAPGLVLGFAQMNPRQARRFCKALAVALKA